MQACSKSLQMLATFTVLEAVSFSVGQEGLTWLGEHLVLKAATENSRHRSTAETFMLDSEDLSFSVPAGGLWVGLSLSAMLATLTTFEKEQGGWKPPGKPLPGQGHEQVMKTEALNC